MSLKDKIDSMNEGVKKNKIESLMRRNVEADDEKKLCCVNSKKKISIRNR